MSTFEEAAKFMSEPKPKIDDSKITNTHKLELYGLFKQAKVGDNTTPRPGMVDLAGKAKHDAWTANKGMSKEDAEAKYVEYVEKNIKVLEK